MSEKSDVKALGSGCQAAIERSRKVRTMPWALTPVSAASLSVKPPPCPSCPHGFVKLALWHTERTPLHTSILPEVRGATHFYIPSRTTPAGSDSAMHGKLLSPPVAAPASLGEGSLDQSSGALHPVNSGHDECVPSTWDNRVGQAAPSVPPVSSASCSDLDLDLRCSPALFP